VGRRADIPGGAVPLSTRTGSAAGARRRDEPKEERRGRSRSGAALRVLIADGHALTRFGIRRALEERSFSVCGEAADASTAVETALRLRPDACLVELELPGGGIGATEALARQLPESAVVALTSTADDPLLLDALRAGACGCVPKDVDPERLAVALRVVLAGDVVLPRRLVSSLTQQADERAGWRGLGPANRSGARLTRREREVLELLGAGMTTAEIAGRLFVSQVTVRTHVCAILKKLGVRDRAAAIRFLEQP
jgi:two-component system, NarL family, nitrate/nitrite response regulator NarL